ncbi:fibronectin type III domain-containing protein [Hyalangium sp.]|uniref:fibronectin type III domain-containing protein n=1 Tax=Hyalangium sp. TaxID=2028555 RepID=UPI002D377A7B|nr:fibronectin type III domain-containing protein [Hyalangium sp.]HYH97500.1 fibronectin type III domain-containing protein [Hyalangium sp.]
MRTLTTQQLATLASEAGYTSRARVLIERLAFWYNLTALLEDPALDFLEEVSWSCSADAPAASATVRCRREVNGASLAPLVTDAAANFAAGVYNPLVKEGRLFKVEAAVVPLGMEPTSADWTEVFRGRIDEVECGEGVVFTGRSHLWGLLQDTPIETEREYGSDSGVDVQTVMQDILDDNGLSAITLYTPASPNWALKRYVQQCEPVADALMALARQLGWEVREKWLSSGPGTGAWRLWFWSPDRSATAPVWEYGPGDYERLEEVRTFIGDVRNVVEVVYSDSGNRDVAGVKKRKTVTRTDSGSVTAYGERFMRIAEAASSNIDTSAEATTLADNALADLKEKPLGIGFTPLFHPGLELADMVGLSGNGVHFTADQVAAVQSLAHSFNAGGSTTKLALLGKPNVGLRTWLDMEQRPGIAPASPFTGPAAPASVSVVETVQGLRVSFEPPSLGPVATAYELHVSTSSGFTPSDSTRRVVGSLTEMVVTDLEAGGSYFVKVVPRDAKGNRGTASAQVAFTPRYVEPRVLQPRVTYAALPLNSDFEAANDSSAPPDAWDMHTGTWSTDASVDTTFVGTGTRAVKIEATGVATKLRSALFVCREYDLVRVTARLAVDGAFNTATLYIRWLTSSFSEISLSTVAALATSGGVATYTDIGGTPIEAPATTAYAQVVAGKPSASAYEMWIDTCRVFIEPTVGTTEGGEALSYSNGFSDGSLDGSAMYRIDPHGFLYLRGAITRGAPPASGTVIATLPSGARSAHTHRFAVATDSDIGVIQIEPTGEMKYISGAVTRIWLDGIRFRVLYGG